MDWTTILTAVLTFLGGGGLGAVLMFPQKRRSAELENEMKASEQWKELYERSEKNRDEQSQLIDRLYDDLKIARDANNMLTTENAILKVFKCEKIECIKREPPLGKEKEVGNETK